MLTIKQHRGDTAYSWAVFRGTLPVATGLTLEQAMQKMKILEQENESEHKQGVLPSQQVSTDTGSSSFWKVPYNWIKKQISSNKSLVH